MKKKLLRIAAICALVCLCLWNVSCVNQIEDEEIKEGKIPITFSVKIRSISTKTSNNLFEKGDQAGLYAMLTGNDVSGKRYIDNLCLTCGNSNTLIPSKSIFYPEGENTTLDFISYYPYSAQGAPSQKSTIPISVQTNQNLAEKYSQSDFLIAQATAIPSSPNAVELKYQHKLTKIKITLTPDGNENIDDMLKANPRIVASGFYTQAEYDLKENTFSNLTHPTDIVLSGTWKKDVSNKLVGKEFIIIPQPSNDEQSFQMEWNGRVYDCLIPPLEKIKSSTQYEINITSIQTNSNMLNGVIGSIEEWPSDITLENTNNDKDYSAIHIPVLSFSQSNVYRVYIGGKPIAEICKEFLLSDQLTSRAIVTYPVKEDESTDLSKGTILQLLDEEEAINGGTITWEYNKNTFSYTKGSSPLINEIYFDNDGHVLFEKPEKPINVNIIKHTIRDIRNELQEYPIVKIGIQYWMRKDLCTTAYQDGSPLPQLKELGSGAGYFKPDEYKIYFYNGEALKEGKLNPIGWKIPSESDWECLKRYLNNNVSFVKAGEWKSLKKEEEVAPANNFTQLSIYPVGSWSNSTHSFAEQMAGYWSWDTMHEEIPETTIAFNGSNNEFYTISTKTGTNNSLYKALSIRCIKE